MKTAIASASTSSIAPRVLFLDMDCEVMCEQYRANQRIALRLVAADTSNNRKQGLCPGEPIATATLNMPDRILASDEVAIKDYSENTGMLNVLVAAGIVAKPHRYLPNNYHPVPVVKLLADFERQAAAGE